MLVSVGCSAALEGAASFSISPRSDGRKDLIDLSEGSSEEPDSLDGADAGVNVNASSEDLAAAGGRGDMIGDSA